MNKRICKTAALTIATFFSLGAVEAAAAELKVLCANAMESVIKDVAPIFERKSGHTVALKFGTLGQHIKRLQGGDAADVVVIPKQAIDTLVEQNKAAPEDVTIIGRTRMGLAVRKGAPIPDISSVEAFTRTLLNARSITYSEPSRGGTSGPHIARVLERLGIAEEMKPKTIFLPGGGLIGVLVENGQAEIAIHEFQQLLRVPGIEIVGALPPELQNTVVFAATIMTGTTHRDASIQLVDFLRTPTVASVMRSKGIEPAGE